MLQGGGSQCVQLRTGSVILKVSMVLTGTPLGKPTTSALSNFFFKIAFLVSGGVYIFRCIFENPKCLHSPAIPHSDGKRKRMPTFARGASDWSHIH